MDEYTYESEVLPEIEIREIMSLEELLASNTSFVAFSESEILQYMAQLVQDPVRGKVFHDLFQSLRAPTEHPSTQYLMPIVDADLARLDEHEDEDLHELINALIHTNNAPNYISQLNEIYKLTYPLHISQDVEPHLGVPKTPITVGLQNTAKQYVLLPRDVATAPITIKGVAYRIPNITQSSYVYERTNTQTSALFPTEDEVQKKTTLKDAVPLFASVVESITQMIDTHTLRVHLERFGYDLDRLSEDDLQTLITKLRMLPSEELDVQQSVSESDVEPSALTKTALTKRSEMWKMFEDMLQQRVDPEKFRVMWEMLPSTTQLVAPAITVPNDISDIAHGLSENKFTMEDVISSLKYTQALNEYQEVREMLENFQALNADEAREALTKITQKWGAIFAPYVDRMPNEFLDTYKDLAEIKEGTDTSTYLGDPQRVYYEEGVPLGDQDAEIENNEEDVDADEVDLMLDPLPVSLHGMTEGAREILEVVLPTIQRVHRASGVPCNFDGLVKHLSSKIVRISKREYLQTNVMGLSTQIRNQIIHMDMDRALHVASMVVPEELSKQLRDIIQLAWHAWEEDVATLMTEAFAWWVYDTQERAINRSLEFDVTQGSFSCMPKWSPWGPPLQSDKGEGILEYLTCVAVDIGAWTVSQEIMKRRILTTLEEDPRTEALKNRFKEMAKEAPAMTDRAKAANMSLAEAIENKQKSRYLPEYVKTFMLLPGLLAGQQPKMATGCCLQKIGADFKADSDWRGTLKRLRDVKDAFAKKRITVVEKPELAIFEPSPSLEDRAEVNDARLPEQIMATPTSKLHLEEWLTSAMASGAEITFVSQPMLQVVLRDTNQALTQAEKHFKMAKTTSKVKIDLFEFLKENATWTHYEQVLNIVLANMQQTHNKQSNDSRERAILSSYIIELIHVKRQLQKLRGILDEVDMSLVRPLYIYILSRAICLPAIPESSRTNQLVITESVAAGFVANTIKSALDRLKKYIKTTTMPTMEQQAVFITNMREQQKVEVLAVLDDKNVEDRQLMLDMKNIGLASLVKKPEVQTQNQDEQAEDEYEAEAEEEYAYKGTNADQNDLDDLDG